MAHPGIGVTPQVVGYWVAGMAYGTGSEESSRPGNKLIVSMRYWRDPSVSATTKAITAVVIFAATQFALLLCSFSHPSISSYVTASFLLGIVFYVAVFDYHARKMRAAGKRASTSFPDSN